MADLYDVLGVARTADTDAIRKAYRRKAKKAHPDAGGSQEQFEAIKRAHDVLTDADRRKKYDETGDDSDPAPTGPASEAVMLIANALDEALGRIIRRGQKVTDVDIVSEVVSVLRDRRREPTQMSEAIGKAIRDNEAMLGRFTIKDGGNLLEGFIRQRIAALHAQKEQAKRQIEMLEKAIEIVRRHSYRHDSTVSQERGPYDHYSDAVRRFIESSGASIVG